MGYKKIETRSEIKGFWTREGVIEGVLMKKIEKGENTFFLVRLLTDAPVKADVDGLETIITARKGDTIGVSGTAGLVNAFEDLLSGPKMAVRLTSHGKKPGKGGGQYWDIDVEAQPASEANIPF